MEQCPTNQSTKIYKTNNRITKKERMKGGGEGGSTLSENERKSRNWREGFLQVKQMVGFTRQVVLPLNAPYDPVLMYQSN